MHKSIAIYSPKGGVGKTTTTHSLAAGLAERGERVLVVDLDPQANLSSWFGVPSEAPTLYDVLTNTELLGEVIFTSACGVDVIPAEGALAMAEGILAGSPLAGPHLFMTHQIGRLTDKWNWVLYDTPPGLGSLTVSSLVAADSILAPLEPTALGLDATQRLLEAIAELRNGLKPNVNLLGVLPVRVDTRQNLTREVLEQMSEALGSRLLDPIRVNVKLAEVPAHRVSIFEYAPMSNGTADYRSLVNEVIKRA